MGGFKKVNLKIFKNAFYFFAIFKVLHDQNQFQFLVFFFVFKLSFINQKTGKEIWSQL